MKGLWIDGDRRREYLGIAATMCVSFAVSFAYLYHRQRAIDATPLVVHAGSATWAQAVPPRPPGPLPTPAAPIPSPAPARPVNRAPSADVASEPVEPAPAEPVPVMIRLRRYPAGRIEGQVRNLSEKALTLRLVSHGREGEETGSASLSLGALETQPFGTDEGMTFRSGDRLLIQSAGFQ